MEDSTYIVIILLGLIWWRLGLISDKLNTDFEVEERERLKIRQASELLEESKNILAKLDTISDQLDRIDKNTDSDYQRKKAEFG